MAAGKNQAQAIIRHSVFLDRFRRCLQKNGLRMAIVAGALAAQAIDRAVAGRRDNPAGRARRHAIGRPALHRNRERILDRFFSDVDVAEGADQDRDRLAVVLAEQRFNQC